MLINFLKNRESFLQRGWLFIILMLLLFCVKQNTIAQTKTPAVYQGFPSVVWPKLYNIRYIPNAEDFDGLDKPVFSEQVKAMNGKSISLPGYLVPFENGALKSNHFMLSSLPISACYFCGGGGSETVVEVFSTEAITYTEKPVEIKGILFLNDKNPGQLIYVLTKAESLGEIDF